MNSSPEFKKLQKEIPELTLLRGWNLSYTYAINSFKKDLLSQLVMY